MGVLKRIFWAVVVIAAIAGSVGISSLNTETATVNLYFIDLSLPLGFLLVAVFFLGVIGGLLLTLLTWVLPLRTRNGRLRRRLNRELQSRPEPVETAVAVPVSPERALTQSADG